VPDRTEEQVVDAETISDRLALLRLGDEGALVEGMGKVPAKLEPPPCSRRS
jgi:hypothetical protein